ncbi:L-fuculokinase [Photobacterium sanctipauli]|uniref:L-fuculokinase n=1 Tax=Photobacterium sanctipauli TaxID=1342794 RepID=A0A2T3NX59_9GAMM|nr:L-fuculokinase [Photobacterium sanctipauli]PSW20802.1 L-fuculokinase [Photobacterium sanctipauli]
MSVVIVLDCGATNIRAIAVNERGKIVASHYIKNETHPCHSAPENHVWDFDEIWQKLIRCCTQVVGQLQDTEVVAVTVTTFGVDGAPYDKTKQQTYPVISWKCPRTIPTMEEVSKEIDRFELYKANGIGDYSFNTLYKLKWLKENAPSTYMGMDKFVFISSMLTHRLTGVLTTDRTMAGTSMLTDLKTGEWSDSVLAYLGLSAEHFPPLVDAGQVVGGITEEVANLLNLPSQTPVISTGHDTQFALVGSGAAEKQAFLSSGTWEILMARSAMPTVDQAMFKQGVTVELDAVAGLYNPAIQWLSSAVIEWVANQFYSTEKASGNLYQTMVDEAKQVEPGCAGVKFVPVFTADKEGGGQGEIKGLTIHSTRGQIYRAALESLTAEFKQKFEYLTSVCELSDAPVVLVGGGAKNPLWTQLKANAINRPIQVVSQAEATVIGAAMFGFYGAGHYRTLNQAQAAMKPDYDVVFPSSACA